MARWCLNTHIEMRLTTASAKISKFQSNICTEPSDKDLKTKQVYEAIARCMLQSGNTRLCTFHRRSETPHPLLTDALSFVADEANIKHQVRTVLDNEFPHLEINNITIKHITTSTPNRHQEIKSFDNASKNNAYILELQCHMFHGPQAIYS